MSLLDRGLTWRKLSGIWQLRDGPDAIDVKDLAETIAEDRSENVQKSNKKRELKNLLKSVTKI